MESYIRVTEAILKKLGPSLDHAIPIECKDGKFNLGDGAFLNVVSQISADGFFWAYDAKKRSPQGYIELERVRQYRTDRLASYAFSRGALDSRRIVLTFGEGGRVFALSSDGSPVPPTMFPEGLSIEVPFI